MIAVDTSVLVAATIAQHEHHDRARRALHRATHLPASCLAETWSVLTRAFSLDAEQVAHVVLALDARHETFSAVTDDYREVFDAGRTLGLAGNVHDAIIVVSCARQGAALLTLDQGQARLARSFATACEYLLATK